MHLFASNVHTGRQVLRLAFQHRRRVLDVIVEVRGDLRGCLCPRRLISVLQQDAEDFERLVIPQQIMIPIVEQPDKCSWLQTYEAIKIQL